MPRVLKDLEISEVSVVDRGAGEGTRIALFKRDTPRRKRFAGYSTTAAAARAALLRKYTNIFKGEDFLNIRPMFDEGETPPPDTPKFDADHADVRQSKPILTTAKTKRPSRKPFSTPSIFSPTAWSKAGTRRIVPPP